MQELNKYTYKDYIERNSAYNTKLMSYPEWVKEMIKDDM